MDFLQRDVIVRVMFECRIKARAFFKLSFDVCKISVAGFLAQSPDEAAVSHPTR